MQTQKQSSLSLFHFLFCELIEQCYNNSKEGEDERLHKIGAQIGFKIYNQICLKRSINERATSIIGMIKNIQTKVFKHLFGYEATKIESYSTHDQSNRRLSVCYGIVDQVSIYLTWMPEYLWHTSILISGIIEGILRHCGLVCSVSVKNKSQGQIIESEFLVTIQEQEFVKWKVND